MIFDARMLLPLAAALLLAGCDTMTARDVDYTPQRSVNSDISASLNHGPTASKPGMIGSEEPIGAMPWEIGGSRE